MTNQFLDPVGKTLRGVRGRADVRSLGRADQQGNLASRGAFLERCRKRRKLAAQKFFVEFGEFAGKTRGPVELLSRLP